MPACPNGLRCYYVGRNSNDRLTPNYRRVIPPPQNTFRIVGGVHRGRRFAFPDDEAIRPSPDRVRETLFNWLQPVMAGSVCLDLFAGSGALGLEALSRGAAHAAFVDASPRAIRAIREHLATMREDARAAAFAMDALAFLQGSPPRAFDVAFLDPPYAAGLLAPACAALEAGGWLGPGARIYFEHAAHEKHPDLPPGWAVVRDKRAGQVAYCLAVRE